MQRTRSENPGTPRLKTTMSPERRELLGLLDRLCENRLDQRERARLEDLAGSDETLLQLYLDYIVLHGTLHWDAAVSDQIPPAFPVSKGPKNRWMQGHRSWTTAAACLVLTIAGLAVLRWDGGEPNIETAEQEQTVPGVAAGSGSSDGLRVDPPIVRLGPPESPARVVEHSAIENEPDTEPRWTSGVVDFIDEQLAAGWEESGVAPSPPAKDGEWLRRATLDLAGRIPDLDTVRAFVENQDADKREQYVARLLNGGEFAEHLTTVWANLLVGRARSATHEHHGLRRFLLAQFRQNRPWNEIVAELVSAEGSVEENGAAGFLLAHLNNEAVPATALTARLFLGEQVQCSQCHKHPWNEEPQEQFWTLNAFFQQTAIDRQIRTDPLTGEDKPVPVLITREVGGPTYYENLRGVMQVAYPVYAGEEIAADPSVNRRRELARLLSEEGGFQLARAFVNRTWAHFFGYGFVNPVDDMGPHHRASHPELLDRLANEFVESGYDIHELVRWITSSRAYRLTSQVSDGNASDDPEIGDPPLFSRMYAKPMAPEQLFDSVLIATYGGRRGSSKLVEDRRSWVQQFFEVLENEENGEVSTFDGTVPQALAMMNGRLVQNALSGEPGTLLHRVVTDRSSPFEKVQELCLATLSREPSEKERNLFVRHIRQAATSAEKMEAFRDVLWAYLNSNEFVVNH